MSDIRIRLALLAALALFAATWAGLASAQVALGMGAPATITR